jgi:hypothetical protein
LLRWRVVSSAARFLFLTNLTGAGFVGSSTTTGLAAAARCRSASSRRAAAARSASSASAFARAAASRFATDDYNEWFDVATSIFAFFGGGGASHSGISPSESESESVMVARFGSF